MKAKGTGVRLQTILNELDMTAAEFSRRTGIGEATLSHNITRGSKPSMDKLKMMKKAFPEININYLLEGTGEPLLVLDTDINEPDIEYETKDIKKIIENLEEEIRVLRRKIEDNRRLLSILRKVQF